ncbi:MAG: nucleotidyl transferase AbiEii/AbiGii toxin family protein [Propionibacteriaceae bacterium]|jgi:predicted nucleotidyltransferase component of viral defense system|nr:nucleotidyl transferase AbiEii/AbiGii toxin family protein [Propionibacteriaceae bacterium]
MSQVAINPGHIARHTPAGSGAQGRDAAIVDIAQDLLLRHLHEQSALEAVVFKGGTALRKLYAGTAGRFSLDLDFGLARIGDDPDDVLTELVSAIDGLSLGPFTYEMTERRGKWILVYDHSFGGAPVSLASKLDLSPPPWLPPARRGWVPLPVHQRYGDTPLPKISIVPLAENLAEKIARLNRTTPARDMYDLRWAATHPSAAGPLDRALIRRMAVLKTWVDANGLHGGGTFWKPGHEGLAFDARHWLRDRSHGDFDVEDIGALAVPAPTPTELSDAIRAHFRFLADLDDDEQVIARAREQDRPLALRLLSELPSGRLNGIGLY